MTRLILLGSTIFLLCLLLTASALASAPPIRIAAVFAKSGEAAEDNLELFEAVRFAVDEFNAKGGLHGRAVELREYDNHSTPIQSRLAARQAVQDGNVAVIGASWSSHSLAMAPYLQKMKIPMISPDSTHPDVTAAGDFIFRACFIDPFQGQALARFAYDQLKAHTAVIVRNITSDYSLGLSEEFSKRFARQGGHVNAVLNYKSQQQDFRDILTHVRQLNPDVLFIPGHAESGFIVRQAQEMGIQAIMLGGDGWPYRQFYANGGQDLKTGYYSAHWNKQLPTQASQRFIHEYKKVYDVTDFAAIAYDAACLLLNAISNATTPTPQDIRDALAQTHDFHGVTGDITFNQQGDPQKQVIIMKISDGRPSFYALVKPE